MSRRKRKRAPVGASPLANVLGPLDGAKIPGGCDHCDAYQTVRPASALEWHIVVHHDDDCPWLAGRA
jgi:hypothetical protein